MNSSLGDKMTLDLASQTSLVLRPIASKQLDASQTIAGRYRWLTDAGIESSLQISAQASTIEIEGFLKEERKTYDIDYQGRYTFSAHDLIWGLSHRTTSDLYTTNPLILSFNPNEFTQRTTGVFLQDEWTLIPETLQFGMGARWDYTNLGGNTVAPNATLMWTPTRSDALWAKYAQAPRAPSRAEQYVSILNTVRPAQAPIPIPIVLRTGRVQLSYTWTRIEMDDSSNPIVQGAGNKEEVGTPRHHGSLRSQWNPSSNQQFDAWVRGSAGYDRVNAPYTNMVRVPSYVTLDLRYAHKLNKDIELALTGRNLVGAHRTEFVSDFIPFVAVEIAPSLLVSARWGF